MQPALPSLSHVLLALEHDVELVTHVLEPAQDLLVAVGEVEDRVRNARVVAELADHELRLAEVVSGDAGEEVVDGLELETAVDPVEPGWAVNVHGCAELALGERLALAEVNRRHPPVGEGDLHMQRHGDDVRDEDEDDTGGPVGKCAPEEAVSEQEPVARHEADLGRSNPPSPALSERR